MADGRPAPKKAANSNERIQKQINAAESLRAAGYEPGAFVLSQKRIHPRDMAAAARMVFGISKPSPAFLSATDFSNRRSKALPITAPPPSRGAWESTKAGIRGAIDSLPFHLGDYGSAALAGMGAGRVGMDPVTAFNRQLAAERGQNRYDETVHPIARTMGKVAGTAAQMAVPGMALSRVAGAKRMAEAAPMLLRETRNLGILGAGVGLGGQVVGDIMRGQPGSAGDYMGSVAGGAAGALTARYGGPGYIGGATGGATSFAQDMFNRRLGSTADLRSAIDRAAEAAAVGNLFSVPIGMHVAAKAHSLPSFASKDVPLSKGELGESLARARTRLRGERVQGMQVKRPVRDGYTLLDHAEINAANVEAKFGNSHKRLRGRQAQAYEDFDNYRVDHFIPNDLGAAAEVPIGALYYQQYAAERER